MKRILSFLFGLLLILPFAACSRTSEIVVRFPDVGQGDCSLITLKDGRNILIDCGTDPGADELIAALKRFGVDKLDCVFISHPHDDHAGALADLAAYFPIDRVFLPPGDREGILSDKWQNALSDKITNLTAGDEIVFSDQIRTVVLSPDEWESGNDNSLVLLFALEKYRILYTGDCEADAEEKILASGADISCDVLKVAHHGSSTSSSEDFLKAASPKIAVISVGKNNSYGLPDEQTVEHLENTGAKTYRTDRAGDVTLYLGPEGIRVKTEKISE